MSILLFLILSFGISHLLTTEKLFKWFRWLLPFKPFTCRRCFSFWTGVGLFFIMEPFSYLCLVVSMILAGLASFGFTVIIEGLITEFNIK